MDIKEFITKRLKISKKKREYPPLVDFDLTGEIEGKEYKVYKLCLGSYLEDLYNAKTNNPNSNYVTCIDELFDEGIDLEEFRNTKVSVIHKMGMFLGECKSEIICSRLADIFKIKTQYVEPVKSRSCLLVDFLKDDEELLNYHEFTQEKIRPYSDDFTIQESIEHILEALSKQCSIAENIDMIKEILVEFVKQYIFKKYIVHDFDMCEGNFGFVISEKNKTIKTSPMYDCASCFQPNKRCFQGEGLEDDIRYLAKSLPGVLKQVANDFNLTPEANKRVESAISEIETNPKKAKEFSNLVINSSLTFVGNALGSINRILNKNSDISDEIVDIDNVKKQIMSIMSNDLSM